MNSAIRHNADAELSGAQLRELAADLRANARNWQNE